MAVTHDDFVQVAKLPARRVTYGASTPQRQDHKWELPRGAAKTLLLLGQGRRPHPFQSHAGGDQGKGTRRSRVTRGRRSHPPKPTAILKASLGPPASQEGSTYETPNGGAPG